MKTISEKLKLNGLDIDQERFPKLSEYSLERKGYGTMKERPKIIQKIDIS